MNRSPRRNKRDAHARPGLGLAEMMVSLAILAGLMTAVAAAFGASAAAVRNNDDMFRASQGARVAINQITTDLRRADSVIVATAQVDLIRPAENRLPNETTRSFIYSAAAQTISLKINYVGGTSVTYILVRNVSSAAFGPAVSGQNSLGQTVLVRIPLTLTVTVGSNSIALNGAAVPRRALH